MNWKLGIWKSNPIEKKNSIPGDLAWICAIDEVKEQKFGKVLKRRSFSVIASKAKQGEGDGVCR